MHGNNLKTRRNSFKACMDVLKSLKSQNGVNSYRIFMKTNIGFQLLKRYLNFLENENYVGSRRPEKRYGNKGPQGKVYFLEQRGHDFMNGWEKYSIRFDLDNLEEQLQSLNL
jgi:predicted transcriptional regulator